MIDLARVLPVFDERIDPRLSAAIRRAPNDVRVIFAGPDMPFLDALRRIYSLPLPCPDVLVCTRGLHLIITVAVQAEADGLLLNLMPGGDGTLFVQPALIFTTNRAVGARERLLHQNDDRANLLIAALGDLLFRRVIPAERLS